MKKEVNNTRKKRKLNFQKIFNLISAMFILACCIFYGTRFLKLYIANNKVEKITVLADNIKDDRSAEDLLFQVMLDEGIELSLPIERKEILGQSVYYVAGNSLVACFDRLSLALVDEVAQAQPLLFVSAEQSIQVDQDKRNIKERFKQLSPTTDVKFI